MNTHPVTRYQPRNFSTMLERFVKKVPVEINTLDSFIANTKIGSETTVTMILKITTDLDVKGESMEASNALDFIRCEIGGSTLMKCVENTKYSLVLDVIGDGPGVNSSSFGMQSISIRAKRIPYSAKQHR